MKRIMAWMAAAATLTFTVPVMGGQNDPRLNALFDTLKSATSMEEAAPVESKIWALWTQAGIVEIDQLMAAGITAMSVGDYRGALASFERITEQAPDFAEGWNKRATVLYLMGDFRRSASDVAKTLALEPRHFGALSGLGLIHINEGNERAALDAFERALAIHPFMAGADSHIRMLRDRLKGRRI
jgi:tetratricopeptide (TPR) repeat protein